jgi:hypothetical protein
MNPFSLLQKCKFNVEIICEGSADFFFARIWTNDENIFESEYLCSVKVRELLD